jgi:hypothetical protein
MKVRFLDNHSPQGYSETSDKSRPYVRNVETATVSLDVGSDLWREECGRSWQEENFFVRPSHEAYKMSMQEWYLCIQMFQFRIDFVWMAMAVCTELFTRV